MSWVSGQAYSDDLRERVLAAVDRGGRVYEIAPLFGVSVSYIYKALARRQRNGIATALPRTGRPGRKLDGHLEALAAHVREHPDTTLAELADWSERERGVKVCIATMSATLDVLDLSRKKRHAMQPSRPAPTSRRRDRSGSKPKAA
jgi:transposase